MKAQIEGGGAPFGETLRHARFFREKFPPFPRSPVHPPRRATVSTPASLSRLYTDSGLCLEFSPESFPLERARESCFPKFYLAQLHREPPCNNYYFNVLCL